MGTIKTPNNAKDLTLVFTRDDDDALICTLQGGAQIPPGNTTLETESNKPGNPHVNITVTPPPDGSSACAFLLRADGAKPWEHDDGKKHSFKVPDKDGGTNSHRFAVVVLSADGKTIQLFDPIYQIRRIGY